MSVIHRETCGSRLTTPSSATAEAGASHAETRRGWLRRWGAWIVTAGAVRCSAWLGVAGLGNTPSSISVAALLKDVDQAEFDRTRLMLEALEFELSTERRLPLPDRVLEGVSLGRKLLLQGRSSVFLR